MKTERAYAKINTYLNVVSKRDDGYHNIVSIMQTVSLCDLVHVTFSEAENTEISLSVIGNDAVPCNERNLAWRAASAFLKRAGISAHVGIVIDKRIPMEAGLAGGSTDAAAVLRALYELAGAPFSTSELYAVGATLGADVPFCIQGGACLVGGIGEELSAAPEMPHAYLVVARAGEGVSTPAAYARLDRLYGDFSSVSNDGRYERILSAWQRNDLAIEHFYNLFEEPVTKERPMVSRIKAIMNDFGARKAMMSGSGPAVFGVFASADLANAACDHLLKSGACAFVCEPCGKYRIAMEA